MMAVNTFSRELASGRLIGVLPDYRLDVLNIYAIYPSRKYPDAEVSVWTEFVSENPHPLLKRVHFHSPSKRFRSLDRLGATVKLMKALTEIFGEFEFELGSKQVIVRGTAVTLTRKAFELALLLFRHLGQPLSRAYILEAIWRQDIEIPSRTMDTHVSMLRAKLELRPENGYRLTPIYGYGYRLERFEEGIA
jgi:DNA-binding winged helix-turn-helix (wHTH) protein